MATSPDQGVPRRLGHIALRVRDVSRAVTFYTEILGLTLKQEMGGAAFLGVRDDSSHELALMPLSIDAAGPDTERVGMYHMAWEMDSFEDLERLHARLKQHDVSIAGYSDRQCNVMFLDPDGNELEAIWEPADTDTPLPRLAR